MPERDRTVLHRDGPAATVVVTAATTAELLLDLTVAAPGIDWAWAGAESAVVAIAVDGHHATDLVVLGEEPLRRTVGLGRVAPGRHVVSLRLAGDRSPEAAQGAVVQALAPRLVRLDGPAGTVVRHAPIVVGRTRRDLGSRFQNASSDTPLIGWHERRPGSRPGREVIEYAAVWSGEDGGTEPATSMARWGRTTDIEWVYRLEVDAAGRRVPGTARFQGPRHLTLPFVGRREDDHPVLRTCTANNNFCPTRGGAMRFLLGYEATRPAGRAREALMDLEPWTYRVMAGELAREGRVEGRSDPSTPALGDARSYLYVELDRRDGPFRRHTSVGLAIAVLLHRDPTEYRSDHRLPERSIMREGPVATAVELPAGVREADVRALVAHRVDHGHQSASAVTVTAVHRAFLLDERFRPRPSFVERREPVVLTPERPSAAVWQRQV